MPACVSISQGQWPRRTSVAPDQWGAAMNARRKRAAKQSSPPPEKDKPVAGSPANSSRRDSSNLAGIGSALDECVGAICLVEVTLHSLESQEIGSPEQEVLRRALKAIWCVHDWVYDLAPSDLDSAGPEAEDE